jgi:rhamnosyltransferase
MHVSKRNPVEILIIMVLYNIKLEDSLSFITLSESVDDDSGPLDILVYDNSPEIQSINNAQFQKWNIHYIHDSSNAGVSFAYNTGAKLAEKLNKDWLLLTDQDSDFPTNSVDKYFDAIIHNKSINLFCPILKTSSNIIISPCVFKFHRAFSLEIMQPGLKSLNDFSPINSGLCISLALFNNAGGYKNAIKLDYSDFYFIEKVKLVVNAFLIIDLVVEHNLSSFEKQSREAVIIRFKYFCDGAILSCDTIKDKIQACVVILRRALKHSIKYKSLEFIKVAFNAVIFN